ncbi:hypothetical protein [Embleya sp. NBC_00896]|uniref:hypothetical protein n=1 Tax=Embleya sp. NBC_00896 TaxID=2975961 RepID=UPI00386F1934|nr:hypothetical protein OG928_04125 [Embleya sp. NBC_00896]
MSIAVDASAGTHARDLVEDFDDAFHLDPDVPVSALPTERRACPECGVVLIVEADADRTTVPDHAVCPSARDPFGIRACPGSGAVFADAADAATGTPPPPPRPPVTALPVGLDWRAQPFSHTL